MATNLSIDTVLLEAALQTSGLKTKRETVNLALKEFIQRRKNAEILALFGAVAYDADYDYKEARRLRFSTYAEDTVCRAHTLTS